MTKDTFRPVLVLASASPRRRQLIENLGLPLRIAKLVDIDESYSAHLSAAEIPAYISRKKAEPYLPELRPGEVLVTADTIVALPSGEILGKPHSRQEAVEMLHSLSGCTHTVVTGVTLATPGKAPCTFSEQTRVEFDRLTDAEIDHYVDTYRPMDKAGAYGIQEWIGYIGIPAIHGCYYNVMGLPLARLYRELRNYAGSLHVTV